MDRSRNIVTLLALIAFAAPTHAGEIDTVAGAGGANNNGGAGPTNRINIGQPFGVEIGPDGALYVTEVQNHRVLRVDLRKRQVTTVAGNGKKGYSGDNGPAVEASLNEPYEVRFDSRGNMYFVEMQNHLIRRVDAKTGVISTVAGTGEAGYGGDDGPALQAKFRRPHSIAMQGDEAILVADIGNHRIRRVNLKSGVVTTIAGNGERKLPVDGSIAHGKPMLGPRALFVQGDTLWIALREGHSVWRMSLASGKLKHIAGSGKKGFSGDGGDPMQATFNGPKGIAVGPEGNVFVVDTENQTIRRIDLRRNRITTIAGGGPEHRGGRGDGGEATKAELDRPHGVCVGKDGAVYIGDTVNHRVRRVR